MEYQCPSIHWQFDGLACPPTAGAPDSPAPTMYEDSWYSFVPEFQHRRAPSTTQSTGHRRKESLLQQPNVRGPSPIPLRSDGPSRLAGTCADMHGLRLTGDSRTGGRLRTTARALRGPGRCQLPARAHPLAQGKVVLGFLRRREGPAGRPRAQEEAQEEAGRPQLGGPRRPRVRVGELSGRRRGLR